MEHVVELDGIVTGFNVTKHCIDCMCGKNLIKIDKQSKISMRNFEIESLMKNIHKKMFNCAGIYGDTLVTVSYPCSEIAFWNKDTLEKIKVINIPLKLSGSTHIENNFMYISSRNILGIDKIKLNE